MIIYVLIIFILIVRHHMWSLFERIILILIYLLAPVVMRRIIRMIIKSLWTGVITLTCVVNFSLSSSLTSWIFWWKTSLRWMHSRIHLIVWGTLNIFCTIIFFIISDWLFLISIIVLRFMLALSVHVVILIVHLLLLIIWLVIYVRSFWILTIILGVW